MEAELMNRLIGSSKPVSRVTAHPFVKHLVEKLSYSITSRLLHSLPQPVAYTLDEMTNRFQLYHEELLKSDRERSTIARYWQIISSYQMWLDGKYPDEDNATVAFVGSEQLLYLAMGFEKLFNIHLWMNQSTA